MLESSDGIIVCEACGRRFKWKAELAGRQAKCSCGEMITVPAERPGDELYDLAEEPAAKPPVVISKAIGVGAATPSIRPASWPATRGGGQSPAKQSKPVIQYQSTDSSSTKFSTEKLRDVQAPLALIGIGVIVQLVAAWLRSSHTSADLSGALILIMVQMIISTAFMLVAVYIAARLRGIHLGSFWSAILKLAAISVAPPAMVMLLYPVLFLIPLLGGLIGLGIEFCLFFALLGFFFELDESDTWYCVMVMFIVNVGIVVGMPLLVRWI